MEELNNTTSLNSKQLEVQQDIVNAVLQERKLQDNIFGPSPRNLHAGVWLGVLVEEVGEVAKALLEQESDGYKDELIQVAAVAIAALEDYYAGKQEYDYESVECGIQYKEEQVNN